MALSAQDTLRGKAIRVTAPSLKLNRVEGLYTWRQGDTLTLTSVDTARRIPIAAITRLDVAVGRNRMRGALFGAGLGLITAGLQLGIDRAISGRSRLETSSVFAQLGDATAGGAIVGVLAFPFRRWKAVDPSTMR